jgi:hypothetical protein
MMRGQKELFLLEQSALKVSVKKEAPLLPLMPGLARMLELAMPGPVEMVVAEMVVVAETAGGVPQGLLGLGTEKGLAE